MPSIPKAILERSQSLKEGEVLAPKEFLHLGSRAAVDQAFCRLVKAGQMMRVARGTYVAPVRTNGCTKVPSIMSVMKSIAAQGKHGISFDGARAAKMLGLTKSSIRRDVYLTTGRSKQLAVGSRRVHLQHAPYWWFSLGSSPAGEALRALAWMGEEQAERSAQMVRQRLAKAEWESLASVRASLPSWMAIALGKAAMHDGPR
ncbi:MULTISPECIES: DUF6088 family protein [Pseudomonas]|uniref:DUF6088 family protein n=1 Tax=Pseudomonas TaxID=286 RepID=UPI00235FF834|nr:MULTISPECIES: DUF6088 family protein [Pseudomonas]WJV23201.1 DUF6088 family protein [Pseudomonas chlororaphis]